MIERLKFSLKLVRVQRNTKEMGHVKKENNGERRHEEDMMKINTKLFLIDIGCWRATE